MNLLILSDIHDHLWKLDRILDQVKADVLICCGDLCAPFVMASMAKQFARPIHVVFGNNDADLFRITRIATNFGERVHLHGELGEVALDGISIAINHFPEIARGLARSGQYDLVCFGHNHRRESQTIRGGEKAVHLLNPGPVMGMALQNGNPVRVASSFAMFDTEKREASLWTLDESEEGEGPRRLTN
ncbi:MAG: metallophosphoesterase family protein [Bacteroidota bacterium]